MEELTRDPCSIRISPDLIRGDKPLFLNLDTAKRTKIASEAGKDEALLVDTPPDHFYVHRMVRQVLPSCAKTMNDLCEGDQISKITPAYRFVLDVSGERARIADDMSITDDVPEILLISGMHAREWMSQEAVLHMITLMMEEYVMRDDDGNSDNNKLIMWVIPCVNLFGMLSSSCDSIVGLECPRDIRPYDRRMTRKYCGDLGLDPNRCFPVAWQDNVGLGIETHQCYSGKAPLQSPECQWLDRFLRAHKDKLILMMDLHNCGDCVYEIPIFNQSKYGNEATARIAEIMRGFLSKSEAHLLGDHIQSSHQKLYDAGGSFIDYCIFWGGVPSLALEVGEMKRMFTSDEPIQESRKKELSDLLIRYFPKFHRDALAIKENMREFSPAFVL